MKYAPNTPHARGFSLIELLLVVAVIGILASILIVAVGKVRARANETKCIANLRQMAVAAKLYANENKGSYPPLMIGEGAAATSGIVLLRPYLEQNKSLENEMALQDVLMCPQAWSNHSDEAAPNLITTYGTNNHFSRPAYVGHLDRPFKITNPAQTIWSGDGVFVSGKGYWRRDIYYTTVAQGALVHPEGVAGNYVFFDGHVEKLTSEQLIETKFWFP